MIRGDLSRSDAASPGGKLSHVVATSESAHHMNMTDPLEPKVSSKRIQSYKMPPKASRAADLKFLGLTWQRLRADPPHFSSCALCTLRAMPATDKSRRKMHIFHAYFDSC